MFIVSFPDPDFLKAGDSPRILDWDSIQKKLPWNVIILLGSGFAIAEAAEVRVYPVSVAVHTAHTVFMLCKHISHITIGDRVIIMP